MFRPKKYVIFMANWDDVTPIKRFADNDYTIMHCHQPRPRLSSIIKIEVKFDKSANSYTATYNTQHIYKARLLKSLISRNFFPCNFSRQCSIETALQRKRKFKNIRNSAEVEEYNNFRSPRIYNSSVNNS